MKMVLTTSKTTLCTGIGIVGGMIAQALGGWDSAVATLLLFMAIDYISGFIVAGVFHASKKTDSGSLKSGLPVVGLCKKMMVLVIVVVAHRLDLLLSIDYIRDASIIAFITNEVISIIENAGLMGIDMPDALQKAIDMLTARKEEKGDVENE